MKVKLLLDTMVEVKAGTVIDVDEKQYAVLKRLGRIEEEKAETKVEEKQPEKKKKAKVEKPETEEASQE